MADGKAAARLDPMAEGMAEIQKLPLAAVKFILRDDIALHPHARFDNMPVSYTHLIRTPAYRLLI